MEIITFSICSFLSFKSSAASSIETPILSRASFKRSPISFKEFPPLKLKKIIVYKPCSVPISRWWTFIYRIHDPKVKFDSSLLVPLPNLGFSLMGFITFHFLNFLRTRLYDTLWLLTMPNGLVNSSPLVKTTIGYFFPMHEHYNHHRLCEHGLSSIQNCTAFIQRLFFSINNFF